MSRIPTAAWPTIFLFILGITLWVGGMFAVSMELMPLWLAPISGFIGIYLLYVVMHDACHSSLTNKRWINTVIGSIASLPYLGAYPLYRFAHLKHHQHTNHEKDDPDFWSAQTPHLVKWMTQDWRYIKLYHNSRKYFTLTQRIQNIGLPAIWLVFVVFLLISGFWPVVILGWLLPWRLAVTWLSFAFNYLPHTPHLITQHDNRFAATVCLQPRWLKWIMMFQNYHIIHHLYPSAPFYRMEKMWDIGCNYFKENGTRVV